MHKLGLKSRNMEALCIKLEESVKVRDATLNDLQAELGNQKENLRKAYVALAEKEENVSNCRVLSSESWLMRLRSILQF